MANTPRPDTPGGTPLNPGAIPFGSFDGQTSGGSNNTGTTNNNNANNGRVDLLFGNPFYINPNENISQSIVSENLDGSNYQMWQRAILMALKTKHKIGFIDGTIAMPPVDDPAFGLWDASNTLVLCWILNSIEKKIRRSVLQHENAQVLWEELKRRFGLPNAIKLANLQDQIIACKQGSMNITQYYTAFKGLWEEYSQFNPIVECDCVAQRSRPCAAVEAFKQKQEVEYLIRFLKGLRSKYEIVHTQLLMMKPLPTVDSAVNDLLQHEQKIKGDKAGGTKGVQTVALAVTGNSSNQQKGMDITPDGKKFCRYCKKENHTIDECYSLKRKKARMARGNVAAAVSQSDSSTDSDTASSESKLSIDTRPSSGNFGLSSEELNKLRFLLNSVPPSPSPFPPASPSINHHAFSVAQHIPHFPNHAGPNDPHQDWFGKAD
ncbi:unnamed protein product [Linum trigynum]|uniref:Retrotransposon Copia-like N-terminal domain-containing protein n=1 Tax=Linum trigynum TaxID=586398 RepID=A0AAV2G4Q1_9ROSI